MSAAPEESSDPKDYRQSLWKSLQTYTWIWRELMSDLGRWAAKGLAVIVLFRNIALLFVPYLLGRLVWALSQRNEQGTKFAFIAIAVVLFFNWIFQFFELRLREIIYGENMGSIDLAVTERFLTKSGGQHLRESELLSPAALERGRARAQEMMNLLCVEGSQVFWLMLTSYVGIWFLNIWAGIAVSLIAVIYIRWALYLNHQVALVCAPSDKEFRTWIRHRAGRCEGVARVKAFGKEGEENTYLTTKWYELLKGDRAFWFRYLMHASFRGLTCLIIFLVVIGLSTWMAWRTASNVTLFPLFLWMRNILDNLWQIGSIEHRLGWNAPSLQSLQKALEIEPDIVIKPNAPPVDASAGITLSFDDVCFAYEQSDHRPKQTLRPPRRVLQDFRLEVKPGERVALIGPSGAGKSSIFNLILRSFDPHTGRIRVNGVDLRDLDLASWLGSIGLIPQKATIFEGTVRDALVYGLTPKQREHVTDEFLWELLERLEIADRMEERLETKLGNGGIELSGGEAQRVMVAAALVKQPQFFLIDEATSALDSTTERAVQRELERALQGNTGALVIAHRLSTVRSMCTKFVVLRPAPGLEEGEPQIEAIADSFEELYAISPTFRRLADDQGMSLKLAA